jgi:hypothetical protein
MAEEVPIVLSQRIYTEEVTSTLILQTHNGEGCLCQ